MSGNRLVHETSPYLLQHKDNPVDWWPWGADALAEAKRSGKPVLLSVGYAACHWCHVMAHESFEDGATAAVMNELFVNIKVDREERPDIDAIYMGALHRLGEHGGWPMTMFLDAAGRPFWGGTYFPKTARWGKPGFVDVLRQVARIYRDQKETVEHNALTIVGMLQAGDGNSENLAVDDALLEDITKRMTGVVDPIHGGITGAPKFPQWSFFWLLWRGGIRYGYPAALQAVENTLIHICQGGIYDHLGGGFARYSVDARWLAPHFEKMLYDNALLIDLMTEVWRETQNPLFKTRIEETVAWLMREMVAEGGGFAASLDADSEGEEGKFYVWDYADILSTLGAGDAEFFARVYDVQPGGNWEGHTILNRLGGLDLLSEAEEARLKELRFKLLQRRDTRIRPGWDDKILADWNGLMIAALARAAQIFRRPDWLEAAIRAFDFVVTNMSEGTRLLHSYRDGRAKVTATSSDYANMIWASLRLHQATNSERFLDTAKVWQSAIGTHYWRQEGGGYFQTADDTDDVIVRLISAQDDATPNANAVMVSNLTALAQLTGDPSSFDRAAQVMAAFSGDLRRSLVSHSGLLANSMDLIAPQQVVAVGISLTGGEAMRDIAHTTSLPGALIYEIEQVEIKTGPPALQGKGAADGKATVFACVGPQCSLPIIDPESARDTLRQLRAV